MYFSIKEPFHYETVIKKSRFICDLIPVNDVPCCMCCNNGT